VLSYDNTIDYEPVNNKNVFANSFITVTWLFCYSHADHNYKILDKIPECL